MSDDAATSLIAPVPEAGPAVDRWRNRHDPWARRGVPAHVTLLGPFLPPHRLGDEVLAELAHVAGAWPEPRAELARVEQLPGAISLLPDDPEPFRRLTDDLLACWPELAPDARTGRARPHHLTVACSDDAALLEEIRADLEPRLPIPVRLHEAHVIRWDGERVETVARFGTLRIRAARASDVERVREITFAAKAHWGYDPAFVRRWADGLSFDSRRERWVAEVEGAPVAWAALIVPAGGVAVLDDLWVDPPWLGRGLGSRLFGVAAERARELGAASLEWGAEPNAVGFYEKVGGRRLRDHVTEWGRVAPWMGLEL